MLTREFPLEQINCYPFENDYDRNRIAFFDIETTGLSADSSYLYLIGCAYYKAHCFHFIQWFSEGIDEERLLILSFIEFLKDHDVLLHYNGSGFDIPYLQRKCALLNLADPFQCITSIDLYKKIMPYKKLLKLDSLKQKSLEAFLKIKRKDTMSGGDLIPVYQGYLGKKRLEKLRNKRLPGYIPSSSSEADILLDELLLHNEDDVKGLLFISPILNYIDLFEKPFRILQAYVEQDHLRIRFEIASALPVEISYTNDFVHFSASHQTANLTITIYDGELKYFYENYKDYYYLPAEDYAVHKTLATYVDKNYREKAKPSNCYIKKQSIFAPQYETVMTPCFKFSYQDKITFVEIHTDYLLQEENLEKYVKHLLMHLVGKKTN
jgi:Predicted exonuclease